MSFLCQNAGAPYLRAVGVSDPTPLVGSVTAPELLISAGRGLLDWCSSRVLRLSSALFHRPHAYRVSGPGVAGGGVDNITLDAHVTPVPCHRSRQGVLLAENLDCERGGVKVDCRQLLARDARAAGGRGKKRSCRPTCTVARAVSVRRRTPGRRIRRRRQRRRLRSSREHATCCGSTTRHSCRLPIRLEMQ